MDKVLLKYTEYNEPHESLTNKNIIDVSILKIKLMNIDMVFDFSNLSYVNLTSIIPIGSKQKGK